MELQRFKNLGSWRIFSFFVKKFWFFLKEDFVNCFKDFHSGVVLSKAITSSIITLILKSSNPCGLDDYEPIFFVDFIYEIIYKFLASRIKTVLSSTIYQNQSAFGISLQMLGGVLVANELVDFSSKEIIKCLLFKVDFEKIFDKVS